MVGKCRRQNLNSSNRRHMLPGPDCSVPAFRRGQGRRVWGIRVGVQAAESPPLESREMAGGETLRAQALSLRSLLHYPIVLHLQNINSMVKFETFRMATAEH